VIEQVLGDIERNMMYTRYNKCNTNQKMKRTLHVARGRCIQVGNTHQLFTYVVVMCYFQGIWKNKKVFGILYINVL